MNLSFVNGEELWVRATTVHFADMLSTYGQCSCVLHIWWFLRHQKEGRDTHRKTTNQSKGNYTITHFFSFVKRFSQIS